MMKPSTLGWQAVSDPNLVRELRLGRSPALATVDQVMAFMDAYDRAPRGDHGSTRTVRLRDSVLRARRGRPMTRAMTQGMDAPTRVLRLSQVQARTGLSRSTIYMRVANGTFPQPVRLGARAIGWIEEEHAATASVRNSTQGGFLTWDLIRPEFPPLDAVFPPFQLGGSRCGPMARAADRAVLVELRRSLAVIWGFSSLRYQRADEDRLRQALEDRRRVGSRPI